MQAVDLRSFHPFVARQSQRGGLLCPMPLGPPLLQYLAFQICSSHTGTLPKPSKEHPPACSTLNAACFLSHFLVENTIFICHWISEPINWRLLTVCVNQQLHSLQSPLLPAAKRWDLHKSVASGAGSWEVFAEPRWTGDQEGKKQRLNLYLATTRAWINLFLNTGSRCFKSKCVLQTWVDPCSGTEVQPREHSSNTPGTGTAQEAAGDSLSIMVWPHASLPASLWEV